MKKTTKTLGIGMALLIGFVISLFVTVTLKITYPEYDTDNLCIGLAAVIAVGSLAFGISKGKDIHSFSFTACSLITANIGTTCATPPTPGTKETLRLFNFDEITAYSLAAGNDLVVEDWTMAATKLGFKYVGYATSNEPKYELVVKKFGPPKWKHSVKFRVFYWDPTTKKQIEKLSGGQFVAVTENNATGTAGNMSFEMLGTTSGLYCSSLVRDPNSTDDSGSFVIELATKDGFEEGQMAKTVFDTDYATTLAAIAANTTP